MMVVCMVVIILVLILMMAAATMMMMMMMMPIRIDMMMVMPMLIIVSIMVVVTMMPLWSSCVLRCTAHVYSNLHFFTTSVTYLHLLCMVSDSRTCTDRVYKPLQMCELATMNGHSN